MADTKDEMTDPSSKAFATSTEDSSGTMPYTPIGELIKKDHKFIWTEAQDKALKSIKKAFETEVVLAMPKPDKPYTLETDASDVAIGAVLQ
ncbi:pol protein [Sanghuangporus baumii]|uniref:Pol protein n=1 Tax=Sanghuangporus baumii TaxID=108892 RepID=A0A9Q5I6C6_SANBA|nr:pol protein [Sanghuangporus baumii]